MVAINYENVYGIEYYRVKIKDRFEYIAASSKEAVLNSLGCQEDPMSCISLFGYELNTVKKIPRQEAEKAPFFDKFAEDYSLCADGTWILGLVKS